MLGGLGLVRQNVSAFFHVLRRECVQIKKETNKVTTVIEILKKKKHVMVNPDHLILTPQPIEKRHAEKQITRQKV